MTAKHVIEQHGGDTLVIRVRSRAGPSVDLPAPAAQWTSHPNCDVAAIRVALDDDNHDTFWVHPDAFVTRRRVSVNELVHGTSIGEGDEVFYPGLYHKHAGTQTLLPVMRFGHIALMPYEPIPIEWSVGRAKKRLDVDAYLVECKSWHGFSGSPTFLYYPVEEYVYRLAKESLDTRRRPLTTAELLGMVSSYWDYELDKRRRYSANAGLAVVIHADEIMRVIDSEGFMKEREKMVQHTRPGC